MNWVPPFDADVLIVGAGAAGLSALRELDRAGIQVLCLEARDRIGGRILTMRDPLAPIPIELGAEFIHGRPPEIWDLIRDANLDVHDCADRAVQIERGKVQGGSDAWDRVDGVMKDLEKAAAELSEGGRLSSDDRFSSIAKLKPAYYWGVPSILALHEATYFAGLRKAGMPEE